MNTHVDRFGRVVLPKPVRLHLGLQHGTPLRVEERENGVLLKPVREPLVLSRKGRVLVYSGLATGDLVAAVKAQRDTRLRQAASWPPGP